MFKNREQAGELLGAKVRDLLRTRPSYDPANVVVVGLPRGGVPLAEKVASVLGSDLTILVSKKIGCPFQPELAIGAVTSTGEVVLNEDFLGQIDGMEQYIASEKRRLTLKTKKLENHWLKEAGLKDGTKIKGRVAVIVDDGVATGMTTLAAIRSLKAAGASEIVLATPVIAQETLQRLERECHQIVALTVPDLFLAISMFYEDFHQVEDQEVIESLKRAKVVAPKAG